MTTWTRDRDGAAKRLLHAAAEALERDADEVASGLATFLGEHIDEISTDPETHRDTTRRGHAGLLVLATAMRTGVAPERTQAPREAVAYARALAARGVSLSVLVRIQRLALGYVIDALEERMSTVGVATDVLLAATLKTTD